MPRYTDRQLAQIRNRMGENIPVPPLRKKPSREESRIQCAVIRWFDIAAPAFKISPWLLHSIPNGGWRDKIGGAILKREGQRNGVPDLFLAVPRGQYHGLYLELKAPDGVLSTAQRDFIAMASLQGYAAYAAYNYDEAVKTITLYLEHPEELF